MDVDLLAAVVAGFVAGVLGRYLPGVRIEWRRLKVGGHQHQWNGSDGKHAGHVMQRCTIAGCKERRWKPNG